MEFLYSQKSPETSEKNFSEDMGSERFFKDTLFISLKEFEHRVSLKEKTDAENEVQPDSDHLPKFESPFIKDFGFTEVGYLDACKKRSLSEDKDYVQEISSVTDHPSNTLTEEQYKELAFEFILLQDRFSDPAEYSENGEGPNCYAFVMELLRNPFTGKTFTSRPSIGELSGNNLSDPEYVKLIATESPEVVKSELESRWRMDCEFLGKELIEVPADYIPKQGEIMTALMYSSNFPWDFHFMRRGDHGFWFHKPGLSTPTQYDDSHKWITDPKSCDRGIYDQFCGYYIIRNK